MMKQIVVIFWAFIFGEVLGYIGGALEVLPTVAWRLVRWLPLPPSLPLT